jgi:hypothetical protein
MVGKKEAKAGTEMVKAAMFQELKAEVQVRDRLGLGDIVDAAGTEYKRRAQAACDALSKELAEAEACLGKVMKSITSDGASRARVALSGFGASMGARISDPEKLEMVLVRDPSSARRVLYLKGAVELVAKSEKGAQARLSVKVVQYPLEITAGEDRLVGAAESKLAEVSGRVKDALEVKRGAEAFKEQLHASLVMNIMGSSDIGAKLANMLDGEFNRLGLPA